MVSSFSPFSCTEKGVSENFGYLMLGVLIIRILRHRHITGHTDGQPTRSQVAILGSSPSCSSASRSTYKLFMVSRKLVNKIPTSKYSYLHNCCCCCCCWQLQLQQTSTTTTTTTTTTHNHNASFSSCWLCCYWYCYCCY